MKRINTMKRGPYEEPGVRLPSGFGHPSFQFFRREKIMVWIKGIILGASVFAIGVFIFLVAVLRKSGPLFAAPGQAFSIDIRTLAVMTTQNVWFWIAGVACIAIGLAVAVSWPGKFSPVFWVLLALADVIPVAALGIFLAVVQRLHQMAGR
jgi:hypothetical protein